MLPVFLSIILTATAAPNELANDIAACKGPVETRLSACKRLLLRSDINNDRRAKTWHNIAQTRLALRDVTGAIAAYSKSLELSPEYLHSHEELGLAYFLNGDYGNSAREYSLAITFNRASLADYENRALAYFAAGDRVHAFQDIDNTVDLSGRSADYLLSRAQLYLRADQPRPALDDLQEAVKKAPKDARAWAYLGDALAALDQPGADSAYERSIAITPLAFALAGLANRKAEEGRQSDAITFYSRSLQIDPGDALILYDRGLAEFALGDKNAASRDFDAALQHGEFAAAYAARGQLEYEGGRMAAALADLNAALKLYPDDAYALAFRAVPGSDPRITRRSADSVDKRRGSGR